MNKIFHCDVCGAASAKVVSYTEKLKIGRRAISVLGLQKLVCPECGGESVPLEWIDQNSALFLAAENAHRDLVTRGAFRKFREQWGLTQQDASKLFGAGASAFAKWESGQSNISTPSALLFKSADRFPEVCVYLAESAQVALRPAQPPAAKKTADAPRRFGPQNTEWSSSWSTNDDFFELDVYRPAGSPSVGSKALTTAQKWVKLVA